MFIGTMSNNIEPTNGFWKRGTESFSGMRSMNGKDDLLPLISRMSKTKYLSTIFTVNSKVCKFESAGRQHCVSFVSVVYCLVQFCAKGRSFNQMRYSVCGARSLRFYVIFFCVCLFKCVCVCV